MSACAIFSFCVGQLLFLAGYTLEDSLGIIKTASFLVLIFF